jgi:hypothetical protein
MTAGVVGECGGNIDFIPIILEVVIAGLDPAIHAAHPDFPT